MAGRTSGNTTVGAATGSSGGSYGGLGGNSEGSANTVYGDFATPEEWGSGSSQDKGSTAAGGGRLKLVAQSLQLDGQIPTPIPCIPTAYLQERENIRSGQAMVVTGRTRTAVGIDTGDDTKMR